ncbi:uncharacterized protein EI90DRAFT_557410 [Cantharellus anzutake]|uniref:uncharacterized protein n=1 Tax=Cantharellus anzutake TaxID=1750568 RepID=UPI001902EDC5|nr:uncharacterized protein EI90DRAFT_557410 [Cantharellus anzutake]KAF8313337.1 hypothetical protein EI90DRAFT_557410 [Cantharellus anzutake]
MRFWSAFAPLALLPIVAADFFAGDIACTPPQAPNVTDITGTTGILFTEGQLKDCVALVNAMDPNIAAYGPTATMKGTICQDKEVTVDVAKMAWSSAQPGVGGSCKTYSHVVDTCVATQGAKFNQSCTYSVEMVCGGGPVC